MVSRQTIRFYTIWTLIGIGLLALIYLTLESLEWRDIYRYRSWYRENPAPEEIFTGVVVRNPIGEEWIRLFVDENGTRMVDRDEEAPPGVTVIYREYSYRLENLNFSGQSIHIYGAGADVRQVRFLQGVWVTIVGKRVWFEVNGTKIREELWPKRIRVSYNAIEQQD